MVLSDCGTGTVCPFSQEATAFCNRCDFDRRVQRCGSALPQHAVMEPIQTRETEWCWTPAQRVYSGQDLVFTGMC